MPHKLIPSHTINARIVKQHIESMAAVVGRVFSLDTTGEQRGIEIFPVAVGINSGVDSYLIGILPLARLLHYRTRPIWAAFSGFSGSAGINTEILASVRIVSMRFLVVQEPFFLLDGYLCLGYNMLNRTAGR